MTDAPSRAEANRRTYDDARLAAIYDVDWFWACRSWAGEPRICEPGKASHLEWFPLDSLPSPIPDYERLVLEGLRDGDLTPDTAVGFGD